MYIFFQQVKNIHLFLNNYKLFEERSPNNKDKKILLKISFEKMTLQKNLRLIKTLQISTTTYLKVVYGICPKKLNTLVYFS